MSKSLAEYERDILLKLADDRKGREKIDRLVDASLVPRLRGLTPDEIGEEKKRMTIATKRTLFFRALAKKFPLLCFGELFEHWKPIDVVTWFYEDTWWEELKGFVLESLEHKRSQANLFNRPSTLPLIDKVQKRILKLVEEREREETRAVCSEMLPIKTAS